MTLQERFRLNMASVSGQATVEFSEIMVFYYHLLALYLLGTLFHIVGLTTVKKTTVYSRI